MKIGIIGQGFVGGAIREKFKKEHEVIAYDKLWNQAEVYFMNTSTKLAEGTNGRDVVESSEFIFVCVPTPMFMDSGECDISIVRSAILELDRYAEELGVKRTVIIKSTVPPGTTSSINLECANLDVCFSPEFLTEANAVSDFENQDRIVIGGDDITTMVDIKRVFKTVFPKASYYLLDSTEAEMVKYTANLFLATKVSFFNDIHNVCNSMNIDSKNVIETAISDKRIGKSHYQVPGPDGDFGFGGHCFPKDTAAIKFIADSLGVNIPTIDGMWETNESVRKNKDWEKMDGRAVTKNKVKENK